MHFKRIAQTDKWIGNKKYLKLLYFIKKTVVTKI